MGGATLIAYTAGRAYLCALHRGDSFIMLDDAHSASSLRTQVYAWNGFGFSGVTDEELTGRCTSEFGVRGSDGPRWGSAISLKRARAVVSVYSASSLGVAGRMYSEFLLC